MRERILMLIFAVFGFIFSIYFYFVVRDHDLGIMLLIYSIWLDLKFSRKN